MSKIDDGFHTANRMASKLVASALNTTFKIVGTIAAGAIISNQTPKDTPLNTAASSIVNGANSVAQKIVDIARADTQSGTASANKEKKIRSY